MEGEEGEAEIVDGYQQGQAGAQKHDDDGHETANHDGFICCGTKTLRVCLRTASLSKRTLMPLALWLSS